ncbi:MAG: GNAT family N-acetyltransferase [Candidatus Colwellbacteria bacterium]|nr:GNAT family N-acetyltransferase [Candidatus Colwellbacteria bacterium]
MINVREITQRDVRLLEYWRITDFHDNEEKFGFEAAMTVYEETVEDMLSQPLFIVQDDFGNSIGFVGFYNLRESKRYYGIRMYLVPQSRGRGYGKELVDVCKYLAEECGFKKVFAVVLKNNRRSLQLFRNNGDWEPDDKKETSDKLYFAYSTS